MKNTQKYFIKDVDDVTALKLHILLPANLYLKYMILYVFNSKDYRNVLYTVLLSHDDLGNLFIALKQSFTSRGT